MQAFDAVVVGAGPAGLSAAAELSRRGSVLLIERGLPASARRREVPEQVLSGVGGAGLFSDGKHSFFPAATALWTLPDRGALSAAFAATSELLGRHGVQSGPLPGTTATTATTATADPIATGAWHEKHYPAHYVPFVERERCIEALWCQATDHRLGARVRAAVRDGSSIVLDIEGGEGGRGGEAQEQIRTGALVVATGRWSPRWVRPWLVALGASYTFRRVEFGVRLEAEASADLFARLPGVDGKLRFVDVDGTELRTFCTCRQGEVVLGRSDGMAAFSGHADGPRSGRSSVGLLVRSTSPSLAAELDRCGAAAPETLSLQSWLRGGAQRLGSIFGERSAELLWRGLHHLLGWAPSLVEDDVVVHAPCIEGVGDYPVDDGSLQVAPGVWIAGDAGGRFRGIVASMISGRYAALQIKKQR